MVTGHVGRWPESLFIWKRYSIFSKKSMNLPSKTKKKKKTFLDQIKLHGFFPQFFLSVLSSADLHISSSWAELWNDGVCFPLAAGNPRSGVTCGTAYCGSRSDYTKETIVHPAGGVWCPSREACQPTVPRGVREKANVSKNKRATGRN